MGLQNWSTTPADNATAAPNINMQTGSAPSTVHPSIRQMMADVATWYADPEWLTQADTPTYVNATSFSVPGDRTGTYLVGRRVKAIGTGYAITGSISASTYTSLTTVTVAWDSGSLDSTVSQVAVGLQSASSLPLTGGTLTGQTSISGAAGTDRAFGWQTVGVARWFGGADSAAEPNDGSNSGSNWFLSRFSDAGAFIDTPLSVSRSTGIVSINSAQIGFISSVKSGSVVQNNYDSGGLQYRVTNGAGVDANATYGAGWRIDNANLNLLLTAQNDPNGSFTTARPLSFSLSNAQATFGVRPIFNGYTPWDSGNFDPTSKASADVITYVGLAGGDAASPYMRRSTDNLYVGLQTALGYTPAHADDGFSWTSVWTGNATSINLYSNWGIGVYLIQIGSGVGQMVMITSGAGGGVSPSAALCAVADVYNGSTTASAIQIWKLTKG